REQRIHVGVTRQTFNFVFPKLPMFLNRNLIRTFLFGPARFIVFDFNGGDDDNVAQVECSITLRRIFSSLLFSSLRQTLMADRGALQLLRPLSPRMSIFLSFSNLHSCRFQNPVLYPSDSYLFYFSSSRRSTVDLVKVVPLDRRRRFRYKICAAADEGKGYRLTERGKRGRKRRELWEELFEDNVEDDEDDNARGGGGGDGNFDLWKILEEIIDNVWILKFHLNLLIKLGIFYCLESKKFHCTGPKAFLVSLAVASGPSLLFYAFQKLIGWDKRRKTSMANQFGIEEEEVERRRSRVRYNPSMVRNNVNDREVNRSSAEMASNFGGWDELDGRWTISEQPTSEPKRTPLKKRQRIRREKAAEPLLLRLLVSLFPFLSTYTNMLK
ncbi:hypothetical protein CARUB_v10024785mg, partial [Capsella rubella]